MSNGALIELLSSLVAPGAASDDGHVLHRLAEGCAQVSDRSQASIVLRERGQAASLHGVSSRQADVAWDVEHRNGQGPTWDAFELERPVFATDLTGNGRWPQAGPALSEFGVRAAEALPLQVGAAMLGTLTLYRDDARTLEPNHIAALLELADAVTQVLVGLQAPAEDGTLSVPLAAAAGNRAIVHQATGMVAVQLGCGMTEAIARIRAHAYAHDQTLVDVAAAVVGRTLRFAT